MLKTKKSKIVFSVVAVVVLIAMLIAFTMAWFSGSATNKGNQISTNQMSVKLLSNKGFEGTYGANDPSDAHLLDPDKTDPDPKKNMLADGALTSNLFDLGISSSSNNKLFDITDANTGAQQFFTIENITPDYRLVKPLVIENYATTEMEFQVDFKVADNKVLNDAMLFEYTQRSNLGTPWTAPSGDTTSKATHQGGFLFELSQSANVIKGKLPAAVDANNNDIIEASEVGRAVYMVDIRLPHYAFNNYQGESTTVDVILSAGLSTSTQKLVSTEAELKALFSGTGASAAAAGDTVILTKDITLTSDLTIDRPVNIDLSGNDLLTDTYKLKIDFSSTYKDARSIMTVGNENGGHIAKVKNPDASYTDTTVELGTSNNKLCVLNWETAIGSVPTVTAAPGTPEVLKFNQF